MSVTLIRLLSHVYFVADLFPPNRQMLSSLETQGRHLSLPAEPAGPPIIPLPSEGHTCCSVIPADGADSLWNQGEQQPREGTSPSILHIRPPPHSHQGGGCRACLPLSVQQLLSLFQNEVDFTGTFSSPAPFTLPSKPLRLSNSSGRASAPPSSFSHCQKPLPPLIVCPFLVTFAMSLLLLY